ncbi:hypothetical protein ABK040_011000 [Willaertia magna]
MNSFWLGTSSNPYWLPQNFTIPQTVFQNRNNIIQQATNAFYSYDLNRSGYLGKKEFKLAMIMMGVPRYQAKFLRRMIDRDNNGVITLDEFINGYLFLMSGGSNYLQHQPMMHQQVGCYPQQQQMPMQQQGYYPQQQQQMGYAPQQGYMPYNQQQQNPYGYYR